MTNPTQAYAELSNALEQVNLAPGSSVASSSSSSNTEVVGNNGGDGGVPPSYGVMSIHGLTRAWYDCHSIVVDLCRPAIANYEALHFFALYHGNIGAEISSLCKENMHLILAQQLAIDAQQNAGLPPTEARWTSVMENTFQRMDEQATELCYCGAPRTTCGCKNSASYADRLGSTALTALLTPDRIIVANCGDSRAFLSRGGAPIVLTSDHTPERQDEFDRIYADGGKVVSFRGVLRVMGEEEVTRSIGVGYLKPLIISTPETVVMDRAKDDEFLIIASASVWRLVPVEVACEIVRGVLTRPNPAGDASERCETAASMVTAMAMGMERSGNLTVMVVDLRR